MAAILSAVGESKPMTAWDIGVNGVIGLLELARDKNLSVFTPSSIGTASTPEASGIRASSPT